MTPEAVLECGQTAVCATSLRADGPCVNFTIVVTRWERKLVASEPEGETRHTLLQSSLRSVKLCSPSSVLSAGFAVEDPCG